MPGNCPTPLFLSPPRLLVVSLSHLSHLSRLSVISVVSLSFICRPPRRLGPSSLFICRPVISLCESVSQSHPALSIVAVP